MTGTPPHCLPPHEPPGSGWAQWLSLSTTGWRTLEPRTVLQERNPPRQWDVLMVGWPAMQTFHNQWGEGPRSFWLLDLKSCFRTLDILVLTVAHTSVWASHSASCRLFNVYDDFLYFVFVGAASIQWEESEMVNSTQGFYSLTGLQPGTQYHLKIMKGNDTQWEDVLWTIGPGIWTEKHNLMWSITMLLTDYQHVVVRCKKVK